MAFNERAANHRTAGGAAARGHLRVLPPPPAAAAAAVAAAAAGVMGAVYHRESERRATSRVHTVSASDKNKHKTGVKGVKV
ncbi:hypothetical protein E2C01_047558 [Portunus trituberculatus]|uniref:Uncharacterized protein n=1 Tax=Portunus trituberculatus TaxID=210409 RepID=A0A5B7G0X2_PORTR|nr:hypothetical protein [Portunus trituberculatus]